MERKSLQPLLLLSICFAFLNSNLFSQSKVNITAGAGLPEILNVGIRFEVSENGQFGVSIGSAFSKINKVASYAVDYSHHFGPQQKKSSRKRKYFRLVLGHLREDGFSKISKIGTLNTRIGWDIGFTPDFGLQMDVGLGFIIYEKEIEKEGVESFFDWGWDGYGGEIFPSTSVKLYYRL